MECRHTASNAYKISLGNPKRVSFFSTFFSCAYFLSSYPLSGKQKKKTL